MTRALTSLFIALLALSACASRYEWTKDGAGDGEIEMARDDCKAEAHDYGFMEGRDQATREITSHGYRYSELTTISAEHQADLFDSCMRSKGFELAPVKEE